MPAAAEVIGPQLKLRFSSLEDGILVRCEGRLTNQATELFKSEIKKLFPQNKRIVLEMYELNYMDSSGLGAVVGLFVSAKSAGCQFQICNLSRPVKELLGLTKVLEAFESCGSHLTRLP